MTNWASTIQAGGPIGWWRLNEPSGITAFDEVGVNHGTYSGTLTLGVPGLLLGETGNTAVLFNNSTVQRVTVPGANLNPASLTLVVMFRASAWNGNNRLVQKGNADQQWRLFREGATFYWEVSGHGLAAAPDMDAAPHIVHGTYDAATGRLAVYVDGRLVGSTLGLPGAAVSTTDALNIGQKPGGVTPGDGFNGTIDEVVLYGYAMSPARVKTQADAALGRTPGEGIWRLYLRDPALQRQGEIDDFASLETTVRLNDVGTWTLDMDRRQRHAANLSQPGWGVLLYRDDTVVMSGPATSWRRSEGDRKRLTITGADDNIWLRRRQASPVPSASSPPYSAQEYDVRTGIASTILRQYVDVNLGPSAVTLRRKAVLGIDPLVGSTVTGRARWQRLLALLQELALAGGVGFRLIQVGTTLEFQVYQPTDKTDTVKFSSDLGNLAGYEYELIAPEATYVYVAGGGEGTARTVRERSDPSLSMWGRIEGELRDRRDTTDATELDQSGDEVLVEQGQKTRLAITPIDTRQIAYGSTYDLGDMVTITVDEEEIQDLVREVTIKLEAGGKRTTPNIGTDRADVLRIFENFRAMVKRISDLERRR